MRGWLFRPLARLSVKLRIDGGVDDDDGGGGGGDDDDTPALLNLLSMRRTTDRYSQRFVGTSPLLVPDLSRVT